MTAVWEPQPITDYAGGVNNYVPNLFGSPAAPVDSAPTQRPVYRPSVGSSGARPIPARVYDPEYEMELERQRLLARAPAPQVVDQPIAEDIAPQPLPRYLPQAPTSYGHFAVPTGVDPMANRASDNMIRALGMKSLFGMKFDNPASINTSMDNADVTAMSYSPEYRQYVDYLTPLVGYDAAAKAATYHTAGALGAGGSLSNSAAWAPVANSMSRATADLNAQVGLTGVDTNSELAFPYVGAGQVQAAVRADGSPTFYAPSGEEVMIDPRLSPVARQAEINRILGLISQPPGSLPTGGIGARGRAAAVPGATGGLATALAANTQAQMKQANALALMAARDKVAKEQIKLREAVKPAKAGRAPVDRVADDLKVYLGKKEIDAKFPKTKAGAPVAPAPL
jgi:hypothetical protein